ncbi:hypothetical protein N665_0028s0006 [Sinapis alba]|nr:hypothetical protein N665_0028s0006 [Sinapis alba]
MIYWSVNIDPRCVLCSELLETRDHLLFECQYSSDIWEALTKGFLREQYTTKWTEILALILADSQQVPKFILQYVFQAVMYFIWRERNARRHGEKPSPATRLGTFVGQEYQEQIHYHSTDGR